jgi:hypothetical protein
MYLSVTTIVLGELGQWASLLYYRRSYRRYDRISPHVWIGGRLTEREATGAYLLAAGRARTADEAIAIIRGVRPSLAVCAEAVTALRRFEATLTQKAAPREMPRSALSTLLANVLAGGARLLCGTPRWVGGQPGARQRIYFANHTSHLDFLVLWGSLPVEERRRTRPVAGRDYWNRTRLRRYLAERGAGRSTRPEWGWLPPRRDRSGTSNCRAISQRASSESVAHHLSRRNTR